MPSFAEQMKRFTDEVVKCGQERTAAVTDLRKLTANFLDDTRTFLKDMSAKQAAQAAQLRSDLAADRQERSRRLTAFRDNVRRQQRAANERMRQMLDRNRGDRQKYVHQMLTQFELHQQELARDFQEAARIWRNH